MTLEVLNAGEARPDRPSLIFVHGAFSGAWIWAGHFLPYFADHGWHCIAPSLRGHGRSEGRERLNHFGLDDYVKDIRSVAKGLDRPPIIIGYSMGGVVSQRFVTRDPAAAQVLMGSGPPSGFGGPLWSMMVHHPRLLWQLARMETLGEDAIDPEVMYQGLLSPQFPRDEALKFLPFLQPESRRASFELLLPHHVHRPRPDFPTLVIGGDKDAFIPVTALHATAAHWQAQLVIQSDVHHGMTLDTTWERTAGAVRGWLEQRFR